MTARAFSRPEFSRLERAEAIGEGERHLDLAATPAECAALAARFDLRAVERLEARFTVRRDAAGIVVRGRVRAAVVQACSVTDEPLPAVVDEAVALRFVAGQAGEPDEIELDADALDIVSFDGVAIDLGEASAETMMLALDPFPRGPGAAAALRAAGVLSEEEAKPAGALAGLKAALEQRRT